MIMNTQNQESEMKVLPIKEPKACTFQVCTTQRVADMLVRVAQEHYNGRVSHAIMGLIEEPLKEAYERLCANP